MTRIVVKNFHNITANGILSMTAKQMDKIKQAEQIQLQSIQNVKPLIVKIPPIPLDTQKTQRYQKRILPDTIVIQPPQKVGIFNNIINKSKTVLGKFKNLFNRKKE